MITSQFQQEAKVARLEQELSEARSDVARLEQSALTANDSQTATQTTTTTQTAQPMTNLIRNSDHNHSVNSWFEAAPSNSNKDREAANVYVHAPDAAARITDGAIAAASNVLTSASNPFVSSDAGKRIVVAGAGVAGAALVTTIQTVNSASSIVLANAAAVAASNAVVRFRLQKLTKTNSKTNPGDAVNDALKDASHTGYGANIADPDWRLNQGIVRTGSTNTIDYPFGYYTYVPGDGAGNGTNFVPLHGLFPGRAVNVRLNAARVSQFVKPKGRLFFGIWNNADGELRFATGAPYQISGGVVGTPLQTVTAQYFIVFETDQGYSLVSHVLTLSNAPAESAFAPNVFVLLSWTRFAGVSLVKIYRKLGNGNVFLLEEIPSGSTNYQDRNTPVRVDTNSASFPTPANSRDGIAAYVATSAGALDDLPVDGTDDWASITATIPFSASINLAAFTDPFLRIGLTMPAALEVADAAVNNSAVVQSAAAQFQAFHAGLNFTLRDPAVPARVITGTISSVESATALTLSNAPNWTSENNVLEIAAGAPRGILFDLTGAALVGTAWSNHPEDIAGRPQAVASNPNGSTQGGIEPGSGGTGGGGGVVVDCFEESGIVALVRGDYSIQKIIAAELQIGMRLFYGKFAEDGKPKFNVVKKVKRAIVKSLIFFCLENGDRLPGVTPFHRFADFSSFQHGFAAQNTNAGDNLLKNTAEGYILNSVTSRFVDHGEFAVISIELAGQDSGEEHLFLLDDYLSHNRKRDPDEPVQT